MEVGIQVSSLAPLLTDERQVRGAFGQIAALGCRTVQLQWIDPGVSPDRIAAALKAQGLRSVSVQDLYASVAADPAYYCDLNAVTGGAWLCVSRIPKEYHSPQGLEAFVSDLRAMADRLAQRGQRLCFHPVSGDFLAVPGIQAVDTLLAAMPELPLCLDLYHLNRCCGDMPGFIRRWAGRIPMVHFKDSLGDTLVPAGQGQTNWSGVVQACLEAGVSYAFVEQEKWDRDPYACLGEAMDWVAEEIRQCQGGPSHG